MSTEIRVTVVVNEERLREYAADLDSDLRIDGVEPGDTQAELLETWAAEIAGSADFIGMGRREELLTATWKVVRDGD